MCVVCLSSRLNGKVCRMRGSSPSLHPALQSMFYWSAIYWDWATGPDHSWKCLLYLGVISQTLKHVRDMFNFNTTSNPCGYLVLFVSKTLSVVWYFIMDLIPPKVHGYFALFESKSTVIFICIHCLIISFKLRKFTRNLRGVFPSSNLNSYIVFH